MAKFLFDEFDTVSAKQWKQKIQVDLKGADYNETLVSKTNEGIDIKPFYHRDDFKSGFQASGSKATQWKICQRIFVAHTESANKKAMEVLDRGAESLLFVVPSEDIDIASLLMNIDLQVTPVHFELQIFSLAYIEKLNHFFIDKNAEVYLHTDIIGNLAKEGNWYHNLKEDMLMMGNVLKKCNALSGIISIDASHYQNAGANIPQQLAHALAHANEYMNRFEQDLADKPVIFKLAIGTNYFFEIAKVRALRKLWDSLANEYKTNSDCHIIAVPSKRNKTLYDYNVNMLRTTTECMSAILGGADTICNLPYDALYHKDNEFGERIARNQLLILKEESYFDKVNNPADGTYYIETLTQQLAESALRIFKDIEANGGFLSQLKEGTIQRKIRESASKEQAKFDAGEEILLGTNKHPNEDDRMKDDIELFPFVKTKPRKTLIEPIIERRLAEKLEQERLKTEKQENP